MNGAEITRNYTALAEQDSGGFKLASDRAAVVALYVVGQLKNEDEIPEVVEAKTVADFAGMTDDRSAIAGHMFKNLFADIVVKQLS